MTGNSRRRPTGGHHGAGEKRSNSSTCLLFESLPNVSRRRNVRINADSKITDNGNRRNWDTGKWKLVWRMLGQLSSRSAVHDLTLAGVELELIENTSNWRWDLDATRDKTTAYMCWQTDMGRGVDCCWRTHAATGRAQQQLPPNPQRRWRTEPDRESTLAVHRSRHHRHQSAYHRNEHAATGHLRFRREPRQRPAIEPERNPESLLRAFVVHRVQCGRQVE